MKLKCDKHKRRVTVGEKSFIHRNGDGSPCPESNASIGSETYSFMGVKQFGLVRPPRSVT